MIVITGGAGFIGSCLVWMLNQRGVEDILIVDRLGTSEKWKNLVPLKYQDFLDKDDFISRLEAGELNFGIDAILHLGACSSTTEKDASYLMENNFRYTARIGHWWERNQECRFIYASSAATYGNGGQGYEDRESDLHDLRPLNMYGYSKHVFDLYAQKKGWLKKIVGLKYFNVFGPNEEHKGDMRSLIAKAFKRVRDEGEISLFKSNRANYSHGEQRRDFIYVKDVAAMTLFFLQNKKGGIYNIGTGEAKTWNDLARALFNALGKETVIKYVDMPASLENKYQYFTQAEMEKLRSVGCDHTCMSLDDAVKDYVHNHLITETPLGW
ncbi:ADP-glyceromanno-heptose 6-epimerase [Chitinispirillales bacterium ANBcel5]|uniref:ADP-glyceromanno-heptose 6-epimerase n=1 Tax=Cellulosispirillum alkaliphilum TaxID=3039283 RepID=UPI002A4F2FD6|nr:ADP-glyceromanno-heptose 6-epimerase [Chitinispirillales bacterium ANBcel5]